MKLAFRIIACMGIGLLFAFGPIELHLMALFFIPLAVSNTIKESCSIVAAFMLVANIPTLLLSFDYTGNISASLWMYSVPVVLNVVLFGIPLGLKGYRSGVLLLVSCVLLFVPPLSSYNPLSLASIAGLLFPGFGTVGIFLLLVLVIVLSRLSMKFLPVVTVLAIAASSANAANNIESKVIGIDTYRGQVDEVEYGAFQMLFRFEEYEIANSSSAEKVLFPESTYRVWNPETAWILEETDKEIIGGSRYYVDSKRYVNTLIDAKTGEVFYAQRAPIPMNTGIRHRAVKASEARIKIDNPVAALICVEIANSWVAFSAFREKPPILYYAANLGWTSHKWIADRLKASLSHWSRLYGVEVVSAVNYVG